MYEYIKGISIINHSNRELEVDSTVGIVMRLAMEYRTDVCTCSECGLHIFRNFAFE